MAQAASARCTSLPRPGGRDRTRVRSRRFAPAREAIVKNRARACSTRSSAGPTSAARGRVERERYARHEGQRCGSVKHGCSSVGVGWTDAVDRMEPGRPLLHQQLENSRPPLSPQTSAKKRSVPANQGTALVVRPKRREPATTSRGGFNGLLASNQHQTFMQKASNQSAYGEP